MKQMLYPSLRNRINRGDQRVRIETEDHPLPATYFLIQVWHPRDTPCIHWLHAVWAAVYKKDPGALGCCRRSLEETAIPTSPNDRVCDREQKQIVCVVPPSHSIWNRFKPNSHTFWVHHGPNDFRQVSSSCCQMPSACSSSVSRKTHIYII